jgi:ubiquitin C-terminal hydrolase
MNEEKININKDEYNNNSSKDLIDLKSFNLKKISNKKQNINNNGKKDVSKDKPKAFSLNNYNLAKIGMKNLGNTSSLNSVLTLLLSNCFFAKFYLKNNLNENGKDTPLSFEMKKLFSYFYINKKEKKKKIKPFEPISILKFLDQNNVGKNPFEIINYIFETLHNELNTAKISNKKKEPDIFNRNDVIQCGIENFRDSNFSLISNKFNLFEIVELQCTICNSKFYSFIASSNLKLDILGCYEDRVLSLKDCLNYQKKINQENNFCNKCNKSAPVMKSSKIFSLSNLLMIFLDRGDGESEIGYNIQGRINLKYYVEFEGSPTNYELIGVISTTLKMDDYTYVSFCKSPNDNKWYYYDNEIVEKTEFELLITMNDGYQYIPHILLYKSLWN